MLSKNGKKLLVGLVLVLGCLLIAHFSTKAQIGGEAVQPLGPIWGNIYPHSDNCEEGTVDARIWNGSEWELVATVPIRPKFGVYGKYQFEYYHITVAGTYRIIPHPQDLCTDPYPSYADVYWAPDMSVEQDFDFGCCVD